MCFECDKKIKRTLIRTCDEKRNATSMPVEAITAITIHNDAMHIRL